MTKEVPRSIYSFQWVTLACLLQLYQGCTRELFFVRPFHLDHFVFWTSEARLCAPRISSTGSHRERQWHANPRLLNGLTCGSGNSRGEARRDQRGRESVSPETRKKTAAELIWITFLAEILKRAFRHSSTPATELIPNCCGHGAGDPSGWSWTRQPPVGRLLEIPLG